MWDFQPWPGGSVGCSIFPCTKMLWVWFPVREHVRVALWSPVEMHVGGSQSMFFSHWCFSFPSYVSRISEHTLKWGEDGGTEGVFLPPATPIFYGTLPPKTHTHTHTHTKQKQKLDLLLGPQWQNFSERDLKLLIEHSHKLYAHSF